ncbi:hypothetical protein Tco_0305383 [Tanacetum coccineum]
MSSDTKLTKDEECESVDSTKYRGMIGTTHLGLRYPKGTSIETIVNADSDRARDYVDRNNTSSICTFVGCCLTSWFSNKQTALAISTTEAEYISAEKACQQALWMKQALIDYDIRLDDVPIMCDNKGAIDLSKNPVQHSRTKHIEIRRHFLRDNVQKGHISIEKVSSVDNIADILTKPLKRELSEHYNLSYFVEKQMEFVTKQPRLILQYGMLLTRLFKYVISVNPELSNDRYVLYDRVMYPLTAQQERKTRKDYGTRRGRSSTSSSSTLGQPSSSHLNDDDNDGNKEGASRASTPSPTRFFKSLANEVPRVFSNPPNIDPNMKEFYTHQTEILNCDNRGLSRLFARSIEEFGFALHRVRSRLVSDSTTRDVEWEPIEEERLEEPKEGWMLGESKKRSIRISSRMLIVGLVPRSRVTLVKASRMKELVVKYKAEKVCHKEMVKMPLVDLKVLEDGSFRICIGYRELSKIDLYSDCHQMRVHKDEIPNIACRMRYGRYESTAMPFWVDQCTSDFHRRNESGARVAFEDEFGAAKEREVSCEAQQGRSGVKRKLFGSCRNNMGNEPILALPEGSDNFVVMRGARDDGWSYLGVVIARPSPMWERADVVFDAWSDVRTLIMEEAHATKYSVRPGVNETVARHGVHVSSIPDKDGMYIEVLERDVEVVRNTSRYEYCLPSMD